MILNKEPYTFHDRKEVRVSSPDSFAESFPFSCVESGKYSMGDQYITRRDGLANYLMILTTDGCGKMLYKGEECLLKKGSAVLIDCRPYQEYFTMPNQKWCFYYTHFNALSMAGYSVLTDTLTPVMLRSEKYGCELMEQIYSYILYTGMLSRAYQSNSISNLLTEMLFSLQSEGLVQNSEIIENLTELADYIRNHCTEPLHLDDFSQFSNLSKHHLIRIFGQQFGMPPYRYLHFCRINLAQHLLRGTNMTVTEIAHEVGYSDPVVFTRHFRSFNNIAPGAYRKNAEHTE